MKNLLFVSIIMMTCSPSIGQGHKIARNLDSFNRILIGPGVNIELIESDKEFIELVSDDEAIYDLDIEVKNKQLKVNYKLIDLDNNSDQKYSLKGTPYEDVVVDGKIYYRSLNELDFRGSHELFTDEKFAADEFTIKLFGESEMSLANVVARQLDIRLIGENELMILDGETVELELKSVGDNEISIKGMKVGDAQIKAIGDNEIDIYVIETLRVNTIGETKIRHKGDAEVKKFNIGETKLVKVD
ncbi:MAG: DUF2807 domain-containing protein [Cyclobacteriaceae bacterium]|nr:DUF2807 domain-containing protein [Cyclobacteriaceae bacterium SS2]